MKFLFTFPSMTAAFSADKWIKDSRELSIQGLPTRIIHLPYCLTGTCQGLGLSVVADVNNIVSLKKKFQENHISFSNIWKETSVEGNYEKFEETGKAAKK